MKRLYHFEQGINEENEEPPSNNVSADSFNRECDKNENEKEDS
jgi:hypothetical protein